MPVGVVGVMPAVEVRAEGGYNLYSFLERSISTWRYNVREVVNDEDARLNRGHYADSPNWHGNRYHLLVGVFDVQYLTSAAETMISRQTKAEPINLPNDLKDRIVRRAGDDTECGRKVKELITTVATATGNDAFKQSKKDTKKGLSYVESLFNKNNKIKSEASPTPFQADAGTEDFVLFGAKIRIGLATKEYFETKLRTQNYTLEDVYDAYVTVILHELVHRAGTEGKYTDAQVLDAAIDILTKDVHPAPERTDVRNLASSRLNEYFKRYCPSRIQR